MAIFILVKYPKALANKVVSAIFICFALWSFFKSFVQNPYIPKNYAILFNNINTIGWISFSSFLLLFLLIFTEKKKLLHSKLLYFILFFPPLLLIFVQWKYHLIIEDLIKQNYGWMEIWSKSIWPYIFYIYFFTAVGIAFYSSFIYWKKTKNYIKKIQIKIIIVTGFIAVVLFIFLEFILLQLKIKNSPDLTNLAPLIWTSGLIYAIIKYKLLIIKPSTAAELIISNMTDALILLDPKGIIETINNATSRLLGFSNNELKRKSIDCILYGIKFADINLNEKNNNYELPFKTKDNNNIFVKFSISLLTDNQNNTAGIVCVGRNILGQKQLEIEQIRNQKIESLGVLAGGIAHDFNNLLTVILSNLSMAKSILNPNDEIYQILCEAEKSSLSAKNLSRQLLTFSKGGAPVKSTVSLPSLIVDSVNFTLHGSKVKCQFNIPQDLWLIDADKSQLNQVLNNIVLNAEQAMPEGGIIEVSAENINLTLKKLPFLKPGKYIKISIKDNGTGISKQHLKKIFDPYFTTKQTGTGLGLATSYSIIKKHNGYLSTESKLDKGTSFYIFLPALTKPQKIKTKKQTKLIIGKGRILFMDDEPSLRKAIRRMLTKMGFEVEVAVEGNEAIKLYNQAKEIKNSFDIVIMDLTIPGGMGGEVAIKKLLKIDPKARVIVSSGYSNNPVMANYKDYGFVGILMKPYSMEDLSIVLQDVLKL